MKGYALILLILLCSPLALAFDIPQARAGTITVPDDYPTIQEAINAAIEGGSIFVRIGIYSEHLLIDKPINLIGEDRNATVIDGGGSGIVVELASSNISLTEFTIQNGGKSATSFSIFVRERNTAISLRNSRIMGSFGGIRFDNYCNDSIIQDNEFTSNYHGIQFRYYTFNNQICDNLIHSNNGDGIYFGAGGGNITIANNTIRSNNHSSIYLQSTDDSTITHNQISHNGEGGIYTDECDGNIICFNEVLSNNGGIFVDGDNNRVFNNSISNGGSGIGISNESNGNNISNNSIHNVNATGISFGGYCSENIVSGNIVTDNYNGIELQRSDNNSILQNTISLNMFTGITLWASEDNIIIGNTITSHDLTGISLFGAGNKVVHNNFINNNRQAITSLMYINLLDDNCEGNYWSDYNGTDHNNDGIGDMPYIHDANNTDHYPLMGLFSSFNATSEHCVQTICNSTISDFQHNGTAINFNLTGENGSSGFCRIMIPTSLMNEAYRVFVNGTEILPAPEPLPCSNNTHSYLYFTYNHSTKEVVIIPEFHALILLPLFMLGTLLATIFYRRKKSKVCTRLSRLTQS